MSDIPSAPGRFWLEITERADIGANLHAPLFDKNGNANWTYDLIKDVQEGDKVFHYTRSAIVGVSRASGQVWFDDVIWAARGSASRSAGIEPHRQPGQYLALEGYMSVNPALSLADIRAREQEVLQVRDHLTAVRGSALKFPFIRYGEQGLRAFQAYLVEFPVELAQIFPRLADAAKRLDVPQSRSSTKTAEAETGGQPNVGTTYRAADENASAAVRDPFAVDPALVERGCRSHAATQNALAALLRRHGLEPLSPASAGINFDLGWRAAGSFYVAEVKSCTHANIEKQLRLGLGQVLRYRSVLEQTLGCPVVAVLALEAPLADALWGELCESLGVRLVVAPHFEGLNDSASRPAELVGSSPR